MLLRFTCKNTKKVVLYIVLGGEIMYSEFGIKKEILELAKEVEKEIKPQFEKVEHIKELNS